MEFVFSPENLLFVSNLNWNEEKKTMGCNSISHRLGLFEKPRFQKI
jgi:hypothetical protein